MKAQKQVSVHVHNRVQRQSNGEWAALEDMVYEKTSVTCTVHVSDAIRVKTRDFADFVLAKSAIEDRRKDLLIVREQ